MPTDRKQLLELKQAYRDALDIAGVLDGAEHQKALEAVVALRAQLADAVLDYANDAVSNSKRSVPAASERLAPASEIPKSS